MEGLGLFLSLFSAMAIDSCLGFSTGAREFTRCHAEECSRIVYVVPEAYDANVLCADNSTKDTRSCL